MEEKQFIKLGYEKLESWKGYRKERYIVVLEKKNMGNCLYLNYLEKWTKENIRHREEIQNSGGRSLTISSTVYGKAVDVEKDNGEKLEVFL